MSLYLTQEWCGIVKFLWSYENGYYSHGLYEIIFAIAVYLSRLSIFKVFGLWYDQHMCEPIPIICNGLFREC